MQELNFTKMVASGNDFVIIDVRSQKSDVRNLRDLARKICDRKFGVGSDGLLVLEKSDVADVKMRIFNSDGSEAEMCGNGARCVSLWLKSKIPACPAGRKNLRHKTWRIHQEFWRKNQKL